MLAKLASRTGGGIHVAHVSDADSLETIAEARRSGRRITAETCTHYLSFAAEEIPDGDTLFKCAPPIREAENRERLWEVRERRSHLARQNKTPRLACRVLSRFLGPDAGRDGCRGIRWLDTPPVRGAINTSFISRYIPRRFINRKSPPPPWR